MNQIQRYLLKEGIRKDGIKKSRQISKEIHKETFVALVLIVPSIMSIILIIASLIEKENFMMFSVYIFFGCLAMGVLLGLTTKMQDRTLETEVLEENSVKYT